MSDGVLMADTLSECSHTPGPWRAFKSHVANPWWTISAGERGCVVELEGAHITAYNDPDHPKAVEANARLIAAAPDLLAALKSMDVALCDGFDTQSTRMAGRKALIAARAAIAKAEGRS